MSLNKLCTPKPPPPTVSFSVHKSETPHAVSTLRKVTSTPVSPSTAQSANIRVQTTPTSTPSTDGEDNLDMATLLARIQADGPSKWLYNLNDFQLATIMALLDENLDEVDADRMAEMLSDELRAVPSKDMLPTTNSEIEYVGQDRPSSSDQTKESSRDVILASTDESIKDIIIASTKKSINDIILASTNESIKDIIIASTKKSINDIIFASTNESIKDIIIATTKESSKDLIKEFETDKEFDENKESIDEQKQNTNDDKNSEAEDNLSIL